MATQYDSRITDFLTKKASERMQYVKIAEQVDLSLSELEILLIMGSQNLTSNTQGLLISELVESPLLNYSKFFKDAIFSQLWKDKDLLEKLASKQCKKSYNMRLSKKGEQVYQRAIELLDAAKLI